MEYPIYTFGNGEILKGIFDSIAMVMNSHSGSLYRPLICITSIISVFWAALYVIYGDAVKIFMAWIIPSSAILYLMFAPQATVRIIDTSPSLFQDRVQHVPYGVAMLGHYVSLIGKVLTEEVEKVFSLPDDLKYHKSGVLFASNIVQQAKSFRITNENMAENMRQFVGQCVVYDALLGVKYTIEDLRNSEDIWKLVSTNASPVRSFYWRNVKNPSERPVIVTCKEGVRKFNQEWNAMATKAADIFGTKVFGKRINARSEVIKYLPLAYSLLENSSDQAGKIIQQQMMIHAVVDGIEQGSTALGNAPNFASKRAYLQQRATYETLGTLAADTLPAMKAVFEGIAYAAFLFVLPLALMPFGYKFLLRWVQILLWLQMWAPLYAVLNYMMTMAAKSKCLAHLSLSNELGVTIASSVGLSNINADIASMAGYLAISIPFLCIALVEGVGSFVHMASHLGGVSQGTAQMAAGEAVTGNYSFENVTQGSRQISNTQMLQHSSAASYRSGSFQLSDGQYDTITTSDGAQISNVTSPNLPSSVNVSETIGNNYLESAAQSTQKGLNMRENASRAEADSLRQYADLSDHLSKSETMSQQNSRGISVDDSKAISKASQKLDEFAKQRNITRDRAAEAFAQVGASVGWGPFSLGGNASLKSTAGDNNLNSEAKKFMEENNFRETLQKAQQAAHNIVHGTSDEKAKRLAEGASGSHEKSEHYNTEAGKSFSEAESYQQQASFTRANSASINASYGQQILDYIANQPAENAPGKIGVRGAAHIAAYKPEQFARYATEFLKQKGILPHSSTTITPESMKQKYENENVNQMGGGQQVVNSVKEPAHGAELTFKDKQGRDQFVGTPVNAASQKIEEGVVNQKKIESHSSTIAIPENMKQKYDQESVRQMRDGRRSANFVKQQARDAELSFNDRKAQEHDRSVGITINDASPKIEKAKAVADQGQQELKKQYEGKKEEYLIPQAVSELGGDWGKGVASGAAKAISQLGADTDSQGEKIFNDVYPQQSQEKSQPHVMKAQNTGDVRNKLVEDTAGSVPAVKDQAQPEETLRQKQGAVSQTELEGNKLSSESKLRLQESIEPSVYTSEEDKSSQKITNETPANKQYEKTESLREQTSHETESGKIRQEAPVSSLSSKTESEIQRENTGTSVSKSQQQDYQLVVQNKGSETGMSVVAQSIKINNEQTPDLQKTVEEHSNLRVQKAEESTSFVRGKKNISLPQKDTRIGDAPRSLSKEKKPSLNSQERRIKTDKPPKNPGEPH